MSRASAAVALAMILCGCTAVPPSSVIRPTGASSFPTATPSELPSQHPAPSGACPVTPFEVIPENAVVDWAHPTWQLAAPGLWAHPYLADYTAASGFPAADPGVKILWWSLDAGNDPLRLTVTSIPPGGFSSTHAFDPPGSDRRDRPTGFETPPPGCYEVRVTLGGNSGVVVDQVLP